MPRISIIVLGLLLMCTSAGAFVFGGSNLGFGGYPSHTCGFKPSKPFKPFSFTYQWEIDQYNMEVDSYNSRRREFISCLQEYLDNAKNDIERIKEKMNEAVDVANY